MESGGGLDLMQQLLAGQSGGEAPDLNALLAQHADPTVRLLGEMWARRREEAEAEEGAGETVIELMPPPVDLEARRRLRALEREVERLTEINDALAAALGACPLCWGEDGACESCGGEGVPGAAEPDRELFSRLALPAVRRLKSQPSSSAHRPERPAAPERPRPSRPRTTERREE